MTPNERQQQAVERILEDESLRGDLEDRAATALINWASERAGAIAADPARADAAVDAEVLVVRNAARLAAEAGESEPEQVVALAEAELAKQGAPAAKPAAPQPATLADPEQPARQTAPPPLILPDFTAHEQPARGGKQRHEPTQPTTATVPETAVKAAKTSAEAAARGPRERAGATLGAIADAAERVAGGAGRHRRAKRAARKK